MADPQPDDHLKSLEELSLPELLERLRDLFANSLETKPRTAAWFGLEVLKSALSAELRRRGEDAQAHWAALEAERGDAQVRVGSEPFTPQVLDKTVIAIPLLQRIQRSPNELIDVIVDLNLDFPGGRASAKDEVVALLQEVQKGTAPGDAQPLGDRTNATAQYLFGRLRGTAIQELARLAQLRKPSPLYRIWPDFEVRTLITKSVSTVKADAAHQSFSALGEGIVWAVMDSGISDHPHLDENLVIDPPLQHMNFTNEGGANDRCDQFGHGTHVAGIIAGQVRAPITAVMRHRKEDGTISYDTVEFRNGIAGMAPRCKLVSLKVLDSQGRGLASSIISAIDYVQQINGFGRRIRIHGVNLSVGYDFEPEWFACGQSPLCVEVDRLVKSGVVVVVAAGNTGYGYAKSAFRGSIAAGMSLTINDPGNAELAITVGATHREMPHVYGVSYFSSKGPTGDGRLKPDLVAPGEKIVSCSRGKLQTDAQAHIDGAACDYTEDSGTSMAAPHVSGVIAAFLSVRREFIGQPEAVKNIFLSSATDLNRDRYFQGRGLVDLMRAIQSV
jgi:subtilisin family serine protease